ncbi:MAG: hypothetical protein KME10_08895 [Plectolyngbya sp. WJT66-NPBG17]|jgi:chaperonin cofactor prefoldin|nr:hypothetical protein [Plectolyngbya sp. WJT66-NPBG17]MBW4524278.1 hypothetical protein [Phormidium tanganyikae FI6-MK23]
MSLLGKLFVPAALAAGTVFSAFAVPLALYGSQPLAIQLKEERVFEGQLRDVATSYLALAGLLSLGASFTTCAAIAWKTSARQTKEIEAQLSQVEQQLKQKEAQLQEALMSDAYLTDSGLRFFLDEEATISPTTATSAISQSNQPSIVSMPVRAKQATVPAQLNTAAPLHAAQAFLGFSRPAAMQQPSSLPIEADAIEKMQHLQTQLQHIMSEIETIQTALRVEAPSRSVAPTEAPLNHLAQRFQALDPAWAVQKTS